MNSSVKSDILSSAVAAVVEAGFDADSIVGMRSDGYRVMVDVDCDPETCVIEGGFDEMMDAAVETITSCLESLGHGGATVARNDGGMSFVIDFKKENGTMNTSCKLRKYLASTDVQDSLDLVVQIQAQKPDHMFGILVGLSIVGMLAKDVHYRAKGSSFYGNHELADLVWKINEKFDDLNEIYYMGECQSLPPMRSKVCGAAVKKIEEVGPVNDSELEMTRALHTALMHLVGKVEIAKNDLHPSSGVCAVLDDIAKDALQGAGLLKRRLEMAEDNPIA